MTNRFWLFSALTLLFLAGCASPARVGQMTAHPPAEVVGKTSQLNRRVVLGAIAGGEETNPLWISNVSNADFSRALEDSLKGVGLLAPSRDKSEYLLAANLNALEQPILGFDMTVTASVSYTLTENLSGKEVYRSTVSTPFTATVSDAFLGVERLKIANEGAVRANIADIIKRLFSLKFESVAIASTKSKELHLTELKELFNKGVITEDVYIERQKLIISE